MPDNYSQTAVYCDRALHVVYGESPDEIAAKVLECECEGSRFLLVKTQYGDTLLSIFAITTIRPASEVEKESAQRHMLGEEMAKAPVQFNLERRVA